MNVADDKVTSIYAEAMFSSFSNIKIYIGNIFQNFIKISDCERENEQFELDQIPA